MKSSIIIVTDDGKFIFNIQDPQKIRLVETSSLTGGQKKYQLQVDFDMRTAVGYEGQSFPRQEGDPTGIFMGFNLLITRKREDNPLLGK